MESLINYLLPITINTMPIVRIVIKKSQLSKEGN